MSRRLPPTSVVGAGLLALYVAQGVSGARFPALDSLQSDDTYQLVSGSLLGLYLGHQWLLSLGRVRRWARASLRLLRLHRALGSLAPCFLYLHSADFGFGYLAVVTSTFLASTLVGVVNCDVLPRARLVITVWIVAHVALSVLVVVMAAYHGWLALRFE